MLKNQLEKQDEFQDVAANMNKMKDQKRRIKKLNKEVEMLNKECERLRKAVLQEKYVLLRCRCCWWW